MSGIALVREPLSPRALGHVDTLPRWAMPEAPEGYWHIPRSAEVHYEDYGAVRFWCGQQRWMLFSRMTNQTPPTMRCGTCEGRASGYESKGDGAIFSPRSHFDAPKVCPWTIRGDRDDRCPFCGGKPRYRRSYVHYDEVQHRPGEWIASVPPCPRHGWKYMRRVGDQLRCQDWGMRPSCDHVVPRPASVPPTRPTGEERR